MKNLTRKIQMLLVVLFFMQPLLTMAQTNQYLHFDREDDFVILENASQYFSGNNEISITGWFYTDELAYGQGYMGFRIGSGNAEFYLIQLNNGVMECRLKTTTGLHEYVSPANTAIPQVWQHFAWVYDGSAVKLYVNGFLVGSSPASGSFVGENVPFGIGKSILGGFNFVYGGRVDEVSAWSKALSQQEIQDMMEDELTGTENGLQLYYKFNQGIPGGDNTSISHLISKTGTGERDAELMNFALIGETSNFNGTIDEGYQAISFPQIPNHLTTDEPFEIEAIASSGLEVIFEVVSGPATIDGNLVSLTGEPGQVSIVATQPGDDFYDPAEPITSNFMVVDPMLNVPAIDARHPLAGDVLVPTLSQIKLAAYAEIAYPELFSVTNVRFVVDGETIYGHDYHRNGHYTAWWTPPSYGNYTIEILSTNNFGATASHPVSINIISQASNTEVTAAEGVWLNTATPSLTVEAELPSFLGAFDQVIASLEVTCPPGGCGEWDRLASIDAKGHDGRWLEIIRYITPYGVACSHTIDLTDYISILNGKVSFRFNCVTLDNGFEYKLNLSYRQGAPAFLYSSIIEVWKDTYPFGDYANLQPVEPWDFEFPANTDAAKLKLVATGHGWGNLNTGNAAEFYNATHHVWVNGTETFTQHNWNICNPNPDGCQPQNGTWFHNRAGWCPGAIAPWFDFDMSSFVATGNVNLQYVFFEDYVDFCHPNHPDCVTGVTCANCDDGFNPILEVACNLVVFSNDYFVGIPEVAKNEFNVKPNPSNGLVDISYTGSVNWETASLSLHSMTGKLLQQFEWNGKFVRLDLSNQPKGMYMLVIQTPEGREVKKLILQ